MRGTLPGVKCNTLIFNEKDGDWWPRFSGSLVTIQAPLKSQVVDKIASTYGSPQEDWKFVQLDTGHWKAIRKTLAD